MVARLCLKPASAVYRSGGRTKGACSGVAPSSSSVSREPVAGSALHLQPAIAQSPWRSSSAPSPVAGSSPDWVVAGMLCLIATWPLIPCILLSASCIPCFHGGSDFCLRGSSFQDMDPKEVWRSRRVGRGRGRMAGGGAAASRRRGPQQQRPHHSPHEEQLPLGAMAVNPRRARRAQPCTKSQSGRSDCLLAIWCCCNSLAAAHAPPRRCAATTSAAPSSSLFAEGSAQTLPIAR